VGLFQGAVLPLSWDQQGLLGGVGPRAGLAWNEEYRICAGRDDVVPGMD
jgi:hypothetical protein